MVKNAGGYNADKIGFEQVEIDWGSTQQTVPLILQNELDYTTDALTPSDVKACPRTRTSSSQDPAVHRDRHVVQRDHQAVRRQAVPSGGRLIIDRDRNARSSLGDAAKPVEYMAGFSDNYVGGLAVGRGGAGLNTYDRDKRPPRSWRRSASPRTATSGPIDGERFGFEITAPTDFPDFLASAKDVSEQLNEFGFDTVVRGIPAASRPDTIQQGRYEVMLDFSMVSAPRTRRRASTGTWRRASSGPTTPSRTVPRDWTGHGPRTAPDGSEVYIPDLLATGDARAGHGAAEGGGGDAGADLQRSAARDPDLRALHDRPDRPRAAGHRLAAEADHPIYQNNQANDPYSRCSSWRVC